jgi:hypothetical protein
MKACLSILVIVALFTPLLASAQDKAPNDLNTQLRDASYVLNRFEEVSGGVSVQIETTYPVEIRKTAKETLSNTLFLVRMEKPTLNGLLGRSTVSSADLLDVYKALDAVASELETSAEYFDRWVDQKSALDLAQLWGTAFALGDKLLVTLRSQIVDQESHLASCAQKTRRATRNHPSQ